MTLDLAYYGDDFTGSTDVLEVLATAGIETVLFLERPGVDAIKRFARCRAIGLAGDSRSRPPEWMDQHLPAIFDWMKSLNARRYHYKVCSTFDSAPHVGSIGRAIDIGMRAFGAPWAPVMVGVPALRRYVAFGHLFAGLGTETYRIDRHPVMSRHPVTPMDESDLRVHLARQTSKTIASMDLVALSRQQVPSAEIVVLDTVDAHSLRLAGQVLDSSPGFLAGSSGVEYALVEHWNIPHPPAATASAVDRLAVLSGSCSSVTESQIQWALANRFTGIPLMTAAAPADAACDALSRGQSVILYSAASAEDRVPLDGHGRATLAQRSGRILDEVLRRTGVRRAVIAGGDTASHAVPALGLQALTFVASLAPGAPLCRAYSRDSQRDGLEVVFKGGQCGGEQFFDQVRRGRL